MTICDGHKTAMAKIRHSNPTLHNYAVLDIDVRCRCKEFKPYRVVTAGEVEGEGESDN